MPQQAGRGSVRSDCENMAECGMYSMYHCKLYCRKDDRRPVLTECKYKKRPNTENGGSDD